MQNQKETTTDSYWPAIVLCGGRSERMGCDKNFLPWRQSNFLSEIVSTISQICSPVVLVRRTPLQELPPINDHPKLIVTHDVHLPKTIESHSAVLQTTPDRIKPYPGPVPAIIAGLLKLQEFHSRSNSHPFPVFLSANDSPMLRSELVRFLFAKWFSQKAISETFSAVLPVVDGQRQFLCSVVSSNILTPLSDYHATGQRSLMAFFAHKECLELSVEELCQADSKMQSFRNINSQTDYQKLINELADCENP